jgi:ABC-type Mn2+/Zn2+ transport system ATPase subunit
MARPTSPAIVADGLAAAYRDRLIWRDATFTVNTGEFVAVLGPNGSPRCCA